MFFADASARARSPSLVQVMPGRAAQCDRNPAGPKPASGFGGAAAGQSTAETRCGEIEHGPVGMRKTPDRIFPADVRNTKVGGLRGGLSPAVFADALQMHDLNVRPFCC